MASLSLNLNQFRSAGVYTIEVDQSERITVTTQSLRLVPGFSKRGPFNRPTFIRSTSDRLRFYGEVDRKLERKGSFFHRSIDTCLLQSPVFAINLLNVNEDPDVSNNDRVEAVALSIDSSVDNKSVVNDLYINFFDRQRFWTPDPDYLQGVVTNKYSAANDQNAPLFQIANVGTKKLSFIVRKAQNLSGFSVFARDWYGSEANIPFEWIRPYDRISDYFVQVIAVEGDWTNYNQLATDPFYSTYFSQSGLKPAQLNAFLNLTETNLIGSWTGSIIPDFRDQTGANQYIENIVNASVQLTGVLLNINHNALDELIWDENSGQWELGDGSATSAANYLVDLVGHNLIQQQGSSSLNKTFLSYDISLNVSDVSIWDTVSITPIDGVGKKFSLDTSIGANAITVGTYVQKDTDGGNVPYGVTVVTSKVYDTSTYIIETAEPIKGTTSASNITIQKPIDDASIATAYKFLQLDGLSITNNHAPGYNESGSPSLEDGVEKIYSMLEDRGILRGLTNEDMIQYRYVVDTMANGLRNELGGKVYLSRLAKKRGKTTAIISAPSMTQFATSQDPYFSDTFVPGVDPKPVFNTRWIPEGGNPDMPRSFRFSLPTEDNGARYSGVFGPFLNYTEGGRNILVPPAADVSNSYVRKFLGGDPYAIVANQAGVISNANIGSVEYMIDQEDRDYLEPFGYNSIIERASTSQILLYSNRTSFQNIKSDYNFLHVRELLNTLEIQIEEVLKNYVFNYNNPVTRLNIVNNVTPILQAAQDSGALFQYEVIMDESNNTGDIIDDGFAIIDIGVWINKGMEKIINRITVNNLSGISSGGFTTA